MNELFIKLLEVKEEELEALKQYAEDYKILCADIEALESKEAAHA